MSDGFKSGIGQVAADIAESVVKPVTDEVGKAIEEGAKSVVGTPITQDPAAQHQPGAGRPLDEKKEIEVQKRKQWALRVIQWHKNIDAAQKQVRIQKQQELQAKQQVESQTKQKAAQTKLIQQRKRVEMNAAQVAERHTEIKKGVGG